MSVREATEAALASIAQQNEGNNAFITVLREQALAEAEAIHQKISAGELTVRWPGCPWESRITSVPGGQNHLCLEDFRQISGPPNDSH